jgi:hypothetical protein
MKPLLILAALLTLSCCAAGPRCETHLTPINAPLLRGVAAAGAASRASGRRLPRRAGRGERS